MAQARLEIWDRANTTLLGECWAVDPDGFQRNFDALEETGEKLSEFGSGGVALQSDHPVTAVALPGNVARLCAVVEGDSSGVFVWTIRERQRVTIARQQVDRRVSLDGEGLLDRWGGSVVDPWISGRPISPDRIWNWAAPRGFDDSSWSTTNHVQTRTTVTPTWPEAYPLPPVYAYMLWTRPDSITHPAAAMLVRHVETADSDLNAVSFHSADDGANVWVDGVLLNRHNIVYPSMDGWQKTWREVPPLTTGDHLFAYEANNLEVGGAYFMASIFEVGAGVIGDSRGSTGDGTWRWIEVLPGAERPGFTALQILEMLLEEAQARDELLGWTIEAHGSFGNIEEFSVRVGTTYAEVLDNLAVADIDFAAGHEGLVLHLWPKNGRDNTPAIEVGVEQIDRLEIVDGDEVYTSVQGVWADGVTRVTRAPHPTLGARSTSLQLGSVTDPVAVDRILNAHLDAYGSVVPSIVGEFEDLIGATAGIDYRVGDSFEVLGVPVRCVGLTWTVGDDGELVPHPEFETIAGQRRRDVLRSIDRMTSQFDSPASASILSSKPLLVSGNPTTHEWTWSWSGDIDDLLEEDDPEKPRQPKTPAVTSRLWKFEIKVNPDDLADAWGVTKVFIAKNGSILNPLFFVTLDTVTAVHEERLFAYETAFNGDDFSIIVDEFGGHVDGTVTLSYCDAV